MKIEVVTTNYRRSHRKAPRGHGSWAFTFRRNGAWTSEPAFYHSTYYGMARLAALRDARAMGADAISVQP